ncbi:hypothetical protein PAMA_013196 [Pampus argenteus]
MTMNIALVLSVLCSGFPYFTLSSNRLQILKNTGKQVLTNTTLQCNTSVTLYDTDDVEFVNKLDGKSFIMIWLGLRRKQTHTFTTWSDGTIAQQQVNASRLNQTCGAYKNNTLTLSPCSESMAFMCYKGNNYTLIEHKKANWCQALQYCRRHFDDLVSIINETQNILVIEEGKNTSFWTGLMHDEWEWEDGSCSTYRDWRDDVTETSNDNYTILSTSKMITTGPDIVATAICSKGNMRIKVINKTRNWEEAFNYCKDKHTGLLWIENAEDQEAVEQRLNFTEVEGPFWIGLRQSQIFRIWIWSDRPVGFSKWDNQQPKWPLSNYCGFINKNGTWGDGDCSHKLHFLCEEEIVLMKKQL